MTSPAVNSVKGWAAHGPGFDQVMKKSLLLAEKLGIPLDLRMVLPVNGQNASAEALSEWMDAIKRDEATLAGLMKQAKKKGMEGRASIAIESAMRQPSSHEDILVTRLAYCSREKGLTGMCYLDFPTSRKGIHIDHAVILAESDLDAHQQKRFNLLCSLFAKMKIRPSVVLIQGKSNLVHWEDRIRQSCMKTATIDMLNAEGDLTAYLKKRKAALVCLPCYPGIPDERLMILHKLYRSDILLF